MEQILKGNELFANVREAFLVFRAIDNKPRQKILSLLEQHKQLTVTEILIHLRLLQSITSQHLAVLRRAQIVITRRSGKNILYELDNARLLHIQTVIRVLLSQEIEESLTDVSKAG